MTVHLSKRADITLDAVRRVAWRGEDVCITPQALGRIGACRRSFMALIDSDPDIVIYGVTTGVSDRTSARLSREERKVQARQEGVYNASFGTPLPERVVRAIVLARLAIFLEGHAAVRPVIAEAVAAMLDGRPLPAVPVQGNGGAGEIQALGHLFGDLGEEIELEEKEGIALVDGSPCAAALVADVVLAARNRLQLALEVFALSAEALKAPLDAYAPELDGLWDDEHEAMALRGLRELLHAGAPVRRWYQAPVSYRILPRVLGQAYRALDAAQKAARVSLRSVSDNPVYIPPDTRYPLGRILSTGGFHNGQAYPAIDDVAACWADLCLLAERHTEKIATDVAALPPEQLAIKERAAVATLGGDGFSSVQPAYWAEAQQMAQRTFLARCLAAQDDVVSPTFHAWNKERAAGACLDAALAMVAMIASQALDVTERDAPPALRRLLTDVREVFPPTAQPRRIGRVAERLTAAFTARVYATT